MKTKKWGAAIICIILAIGAAVLCFASMNKMSVTEPDEVAGFNGGFEHVKNGLPVNWQLYTAQTAKAGSFDINIDENSAKEGKRSLLFVVRSCSDVGGWRSPGFAHEIAAKPGDVYHVSLWVKNSGSKFRINVSAVNAFKSAKVMTTELSENIPDWRLLEFDYTVPLSMNRLRIEGNVRSPGLFWVDDVVITKKQRQ